MVVRFGHESIYKEEAKGAELRRLISSILGSN
jgi:hypothetical protein